MGSSKHEFACISMAAIHIDMSKFLTVIIVCFINFTYLITYKL